MLVRTLLSLTLLLQHLMVPMAIAAGPGAGDCDMPGCCRSVESTTCCGATVVEMVCRRSGGACLCGVLPDDPNRVPATPAPRDGRELAGVYALAATAIGVFTGIRATRPRPRWSDAPVHRTHHGTQALLCVWQT
jgi:hypothetical protein